MGQICVIACFGSKNTVIDDFVSPIRAKPATDDHNVSYDESEVDNEAGKKETVTILPLNEAEMIHNAVKTHDINKLIFLIESNRQDISKLINSQSTKLKNTPLHIAASSNDLLIIKLLLFYNANTKISNKDGKLAKDLCKKEFKIYFNQNRNKLLELSIHNYYYTINVHFVHNIIIY